MRSFLITQLLLLNSFCSGTAQNNYVSAKPESIYLHTDRNIYIAGDYLFYSIYLQGIASQLSKYAYLVIRDRHNSSIIQARVDIRNQMAFGNIYLSDTLRSDIYQILCYTNCMRNEAEESYFNKEIIIANRFDTELNLFNPPSFNNTSVASSGQPSGNKLDSENVIIHLDKNIFNRREKVAFSIETKDILKDSITRLSVSVSEIIPGIPDEPSISYYLSNYDKITKAGEPGQNQCKFRPEIKGSEIKGRILPVQQAGNQTVISNRDVERDIKIYTILVSTPDSIANMQYTKTDSSGSFSLILNPYYEGKELIIRLKENTKAVIELDNKFKLIQPFISSGIFNVPGIKAYLNRCINISEAKRYYAEKVVMSRQKDIPLAITIPRVYNKPYSTVFPADFLELPDFVEISRELLPALKVRKSNNNYILSFIDTRNKGFLNIEPIIFLDGVPINDVNQIINFGTNQIMRIDMLPVIRYYGEMSITGILAIFSKNLEINNIQFQTPAIRYQSLSNQSYTRPEYYKPSNLNEHIPDVRQVLLWDPEITLHNNEKHQMEFYTSDLQGNYRINIQGITSNGLPVNGAAIITVKSNSN
jgi:hypothetical protein